VLGIDPGAVGAAVLMDGRIPVASRTWSAPKKLKGVDAQYVAVEHVVDLLAWDERPVLAGIEYPIFAQNRRSAIVQGMGYGMLYLLCIQHGLPVIEVNPRTVHSIAGGTDSRPYARMMGWPCDNEHLADACVIAGAAERRAAKNQAHKRD
jgi:Holliday junction resolvasome RuvABC endonuclease subunit